jgi:hypothetical protein
VKAFEPTESEMESVRPIMEAVGEYLQAHWKGEPERVLELVLYGFAVAVHVSHLVLSERSSGEMRVRFEFEGDGLSVVDEFEVVVDGMRALQ